MEVAVLNRQRSHRIEHRELARFVRDLAEAVPSGGYDSVAIRLVSDRKMREFNRTFRGQDAPTDVLSFPGDASPDPEGRLYLGDIVISVTTAARQSRRRRHSIDRELKILALHGFLHLLGYDHESDEGEMMRLQRRLTRRLLRPGGGRAVE